MADTKISALTALNNADLAADDVLPIVDTGAVATKKITVANLMAGSPSNPSVQQTDIGTAPNEIPLNQYLGNLAYQDAANIAGQVGVQAGTAALPSITPTGDTNTGLFFPAADTIAFSEGGVEAMRINSLSNVGIGTASPANPLNIVRDNTAFRGQLSLQTVSAANFAQLTFYDQTTLSGQIFQGYGVDKAIKIVNPLAHGIAFSTSDTERMRIDSAGNVGIGTTTPNASALLDVQSTTKGVRMPNMTTTEKNAIASPAAGLMVFDTTLSKLAVYTGAAWETITSL
jgi:hypothetical protein